MRKKPILLFVYGTLKRGGYNFPRIEGAIFVAEAQTKQRFKMLSNSDFPFVLKKEGPSEIHGEIFEITEDILNRADMLEGHPKLYERKLAEFITSEGKKLKAWLYFGNNVAKWPDIKVEIKDGNFPVDRAEWAKMYKKLFNQAFSSKTGKKKAKRKMRNKNNK